MGDDLFFPTLKKLATDPAYTYDNFVTSTDVEQLFSNAAGYSLKPFFDFYLRTTNVLDFSVKELGYQQYQIKLNNYFMDLPVEIIVNGKPEKMIMGKEGIKIKSSLPPTVDPNGYYLKKITLQ
jgi:hypothetical protein